MTIPELRDELDGEFDRACHSSNLVNVAPRDLRSWRFNDEP